MALTLKRHLPKRNFTIDVKALSQQNALVNLVLTNKDQMEFDLQMALAAYDHDHSPYPYPYPYQYNGFPPGYVYYPTGRAVLYPSVSNTSEDELKTFFELIRNVPEFVNAMFEKAQMTKTESGMSTRTQVFTKKVRMTDSDIIGGTMGFDDKMKFILYFILFAHKVKLMNAVIPQCNYKYKLYEVDGERKIESNTNNIIMFHGTHEANVYSILRNGIRRMGRNGVWMTTDIKYALSYARSNNKVFLCFETPLRYGANEMPLNLIQLRAIIWIDASNYLHCNLVEIAQVVTKYLLSK